MTRNLKALGLVLVAVFAISAMTASAASAQNGIITSDGPFTLKGVNRVAGVPNSLTAFGETPLICPNVTYTGHKVAVTPHEKVPNNSSSVTVTPNYGLCTYGAIIKATVDLNGCDFEFDLGATTAVADQYKVTTTVICPTGKRIVITFFTNAEWDVPKDIAFCHIVITEKKSYDGLLLKDNTTTPNSFNLTGTIEGIEAHKEVITNTTGSDPGILCPPETTTTAVLHADVTITEATTPTATPIKLSHL